MQADNFRRQANPPVANRSGRTGATPRLSLLAGGLLLAGAVAAVFLAGGPSQGSLGIFLLCAGVALTVCPPQRKVGWALWFAAAALVACGALAFLPESWFGVPAWRRALEAAPAIHLSTSVTPVPRETAFWLAILTLSILVGFFSLAHPVRSLSLLTFAVLITAVTGLYAALAIFAKNSGWHYPFDGGATFGFFPNRNHTAVLLETGSIVGMGVLGVVLRDRRWMLGLLAAANLAVCVVALFFYSSSRGGVIFLLVGTVLWVAGLGRSGRDLRVLVSVAALVVAAAVLLLASGSEVRQRLLAAVERHPAIPAPPAVARPLGSVAVDQPPGLSEEVPFDFRALIYSDARSLIWDFPVTGTGLGAFADDFAHYRKASLNESVALHPESDWLMLVAEAGVPSLLCAGLLLVLALRRLPGQSGHPFWPLRWGCVAAAGTAVLHGVVDVPFHRVALGWWILILAGFGLQASAGNTGGRSRFQHALFVLGGVGALALGTRLVWAEWFGARALPPFAAERAPRNIIARFDHQEAFEAMQMAGRATWVSPMAAPLYHLSGVLLLHFEDSDREVSEAFQAERLLNPNWPQIPLEQGDAWAVVDPKRTATLWLEALERKRRIDQVRAPEASGDEIAYYQQLLARARPWPGVTGELAWAGAQGPAYALTWLESADPALVPPRLGPMLKDDNLLRRFTLNERQRLLLLWDAKGDREALKKFVAAHPDWQEAARPLRLRQLVAAQRYEEAVRAATDHYQLSLTLPSASPVTAIPEARGGAQDPVLLFNTYWREGNTVTARRILAEGASTAAIQPQSGEYWRLRLALAVQDQDWPQAWQHLERYVRQVHPADVVP